MIQLQISQHSEAREKERNWFEERKKRLKHDLFEVCFCLKLLHFIFNFKVLLKVRIFLIYFKEQNFIESNF